MGCNCQWMEVLVAIVILVFTFWMTTASQWIVIIAAVVLLLHALLCKNCKMCKDDGSMSKMSTSKSMNKKKK